MTNAYIRFVTSVVDPHSSRRQGVFQALWALADANLLSRDDFDEFQRIWKWFKVNLKVPNRLARRRPSGAAPKAICWLKATATGHIEQMLALCRLIEKYGHLWEKIECDRPGYVVFEDQHQVAAVPFAETPT